MADLDFDFTKKRAPKKSPPPVKMPPPQPKPSRWDVYDGPPGRNPSREGTLAQLQERLLEAIEETRSRLRDEWPLTCWDTKGAGSKYLKISSRLREAAQIADTMFDRLSAEEKD